MIFTDFFLLRTQVWDHQVVSNRFFDVMSISVAINTFWIHKDLHISNVELLYFNKRMGTLLVLHSYNKRIFVKIKRSFRHVFTFINYTFKFSNLEGKIPPSFYLYCTVCGTYVMFKSFNS